MTRTTNPPRALGLAVALSLALAACGSGTGEERAAPPPVQSPAVQAPAEQPTAQDGPAQEPGALPFAAATTPPTVVAFAADIARGVEGTAEFASAKATGDLIRRMKPRFVLTGGDNAYPSGTTQDYATKYDPTWGSFKAITRPAPGNHEYRTPGAAGYRDYFFGGASKPYYTFSAGNRWQVYVLNCEIACGYGSAQERWLRRDLARRPSAHVLAVMHRPRFSSGPHGNSTLPRALWVALRGARADVMLVGHDHLYEVFAKQDSAGNRRANGIKQFTNGAGGAEMYPFKTRRPNSLVRRNTDFGVLRLVLRPTSYSWQFVGSGRCYRGGRHYDCPQRAGAVLDSGTRRTNRS